MRLDIFIRSSDPDMQAIAVGQIADEITIQRKKILREAVGESFLDYVILIGEGIAIQVATKLIADFLYDKLRGRKGTNLTINHKSVEINAEKIEQLIINIEKENENAQN
jgi:hypothetical protein